MDIPENYKGLEVQPRLLNSAGYKLIVGYLRKIRENPLTPPPSAEEVITSGFPCCCFLPLKPMTTKKRSYSQTVTMDSERFEEEHKFDVARFQIMSSMLLLDTQDDTKLISRKSQRKILSIEEGTKKVLDIHTKGHTKPGKQHRGINFIIQKLYRDGYSLGTADFGFAVDQITQIIHSCDDYKCRSKFTQVDPATTIEEFLDGEKYLQNLEKETVSTQSTDHDRAMAVNVGSADADGLRRDKENTLQQKSDRAQMTNSMAANKFTKLIPSSSALSGTVPSYGKKPALVVKLMKSSTDVHVMPRNLAEPPVIKVIPRTVLTTYAEVVQNGARIIESCGSHEIQYRNATKNSTEASTNIIDLTKSPPPLQRMHKRQYVIAGSVALKPPCLKPAPGTLTPRKMITSEHLYAKSTTQLEGTNEPLDQKSYESELNTSLMDAESSTSFSHFYYPLVAESCAAKEDLKFSTLEGATNTPEVGYSLMHDLDLTAIPIDNLPNLEKTPTMLSQITFPTKISSNVRGRKRKGQTFEEQIHVLSELFRQLEDLVPSCYMGDKDARENVFKSLTKAQTITKQCKKNLKRIMNQVDFDKVLML